jgi:hypothetical protein
MVACEMDRFEGDPGGERSHHQDQSTDGQLRDRLRWVRNAGVRHRAAHPLDEGKVPRDQDDHQDQLREDESQHPFDPLLDPAGCHISKRASERYRSKDRCHDDEQFANRHGEPNRYDPGKDEH